MDKQHDLLLSYYGTHRGVLYMGLINENKLKFGITHDPLLKRVKSHTNTFDQFRLVGVFSNIRFPRDVENMLLRYGKEKEALCTAFDNHGHRHKEIIDLRQIPLFTIIVTVTQWIAKGIGEIETFVEVSDHEVAENKDTQMESPSNVNDGELISNKISDDAADISDNPCIVEKSSKTFEAVTVDKKRTLSDYFDFEHQTYTDSNEIGKKAKLLFIKPDWPPQQVVIEDYKCKICGNKAGPYCLKDSNKNMWVQGNWRNFESIPLCKKPDFVENIFRRFLIENTSHKEDGQIPVLDMYKRFSEWNLRQKDRYKGSMTSNQLGREFTKELSLPKIRKCRVYYYDGLSLV